MVSKNITSLQAIFLIIMGVILSSQMLYSQVDNPLDMLIEGNNRFVSNELSSKSYSTELQELVKGQHPYAIVLSCSDSRVPPEIIFDESLGKLFVIRVAGNVIDPITVGSIEYAAEHLHTPLLIVLGHQSCGAVTAAFEVGESTDNIAAIVEKIRPAVNSALEVHANKHDAISFAVEENVKNQITSCLSQSTVLEHLYSHKKLSIIGAVYSLESGKIKILDTDNITE